MTAILHLWTIESSTVDPSERPGETLAICSRAKAAIDEALADSFPQRPRHPGRAAWIVTRRFGRLGRTSTASGADSAAMAAKDQQTFAAVCGAAGTPEGLRRSHDGGRAKKTVVC